MIAPNIPGLSTVHLVKRKGSALRRLLAGEPLDFVGVPTDRTLLEWLMKGFFEEAAKAELRIIELEDEQERYRAAIRRELETVEKTIDLHRQGLEELSRRQAAILGKMLRTYENQEVA